MKITYKFADGTRSEVEVDEELGEFIKASRREAAALERKERYHKGFSLDDYDFQGTDIVDPMDYEEWIFQKDEEAKLVCLTETQRRRLMMMADGLSMREIARQEGTALRAIQFSIDQARKKIKKI